MTYPESQPPASLPMNPAAQPYGVPGPGDLGPGGPASSSLPVPVQPGAQWQQNPGASYGGSPYPGGPQNGYAPNQGPGPQGAHPPYQGPGPQAGYPGQPGMAIVMATPKSAGIAVLLSFLWLGAGHLYANRIGPGVALIVYELFLGILSATVVGLVLSIPLWLISAPIVMIMAANAANDYNRRNGLMVR